MRKYLELMTSMQCFFDKKIIIYGTGSSGKRMYTLLKNIGKENNIAGFCTSNLDETGEIIGGRKVIPFDTIKEAINLNELNVVICSVFYDEILDFLKLEQINVNNIYNGKLVEWAIFFAWKRNELPDDGIQWFREKYCLWREDNRPGILDYDEKYCIENMQGILSENILIYQPAKVGSSSIYNSLKRCGLPVLHIHEISSVILRTHTKTLIDLFQKIKAKRPVKIITMVREPIGRDISQFFQLLSAYRLWYEPEILSDNLIDTFYSFMETTYKMHCSYGTYADVNLTNSALALPWLIGQNKKYGYEFDWFDYEIKEVFGVDVYKYPFDTNQGYSYISENGVELLTITLEHLTQCEDLIKEKLGIDNFKLNIFNSASKKAYSELYKEFKHEITFNKEYVDFYYSGNNSAVNHFYSIEQQMNFRKKWENNILAAKE